MGKDCSSKTPSHADRKREEAARQHLWLLLHKLRTIEAAVYCRPDIRWRGRSKHRNNHPFWVHEKRTQCISSYEGGVASNSPVFGTTDINQDFFSFPKIENKGRYQYKQDLFLLNQRFIQTDWYECSPTMTPKCNDTNATRATLFMPSASPSPSLKIRLARNPQQRRVEKS
jgi:hypothetical protein